MLRRLSSDEVRSIDLQPGPDFGFPGGRLVYAGAYAWGSQDDPTGSLR